MKKLPLFLILIFIALIIIGVGLNSCFQTKSNNIDIVISKASYSEKTPVYEKPNINSNIITEFCGQTCLTCNLYSSKEIVDGFIKVELFDKEGYVKLDDCEQDTLILDNIKNKQRQEVCLNALKHLGVPYSQVQCNSLVSKSYKSLGTDFNNLSAPEFNSDKIGKNLNENELQPGDIVFYTGLNGRTPYGHVGLYLGQGYVIQSTADQGKEYPTGGVRITKLVFRSAPTAFRSPLV